MLEYEELQQFYNRFYHPSNARIWFYGDDPEETRLHLIAENLNRFVKDDEARSASVIKAQPTFAAPRAAKGKFPAQEFEGAIAGIAWALTRGTDGFPEEDELPMWVLDDLLVGRRTAAVYSAMQNSSLGTFLEDVAGLDEGELVVRPAEPGTSPPSCLVAPCRRFAHRAPGAVTALGRAPASLCILSWTVPCRNPSRRIPAPSRLSGISPLLVFLVERLQRMIPPVGWCCRLHPACDVCDDAERGGTGRCKGARPGDGDLAETGDRGVQ